MYSDISSYEEISLPESEQSYEDLHSEKQLGLSTNSHTSKEHMPIGYNLKPHNINDIPHDDKKRLLPPAPVKRLTDDNLKVLDQPTESAMKTFIERWVDQVSSMIGSKIK